MGFFKSLEKHLDSINLNMTITKGENGLIVSVLPVLHCKDDTKKSITPILLKGTSEELDEQFAGIIQQPLEIVSGISTNIIEFEQSVAKAKENSVIKKAEAEKNKKAKTKTDKEGAKAKTKAEKDLEKLNIKADKELEKAQTYIDKKEYGKAVYMIKSALKISPKYEKSIKMLEEAEKLDTPDLFKEDSAKSTLTSDEFVEANKEIDSAAIVNPTSMKEVAIEEQQEASQPESLIGAPKPKRKDLEPMEKYESRLKAWELLNDDEAKGPNKTPLEGEDAQLSAAMHKEEAKSPFKEKPELSGMPLGTEFDTPEVDDDDDDDFDDFDDASF